MEFATVLPTNSRPYPISSSLRTRKNQGDFSSGMGGYINDFVLWDRALTEDEALLIYSQGVDCGSPSNQKATESLR